MTPPERPGPPFGSVPGQPQRPSPEQPGWPNQPAGGPGQPSLTPEQREAHTRQRVVQVLGPGEPLVDVVWCSKGFVDYKIDNSTMWTQTMRPSSIAGELLFDNGSPDQQEYRSPVNPSCGGPPHGLGPALDATMPDTWQHLAVTVTATRMLVLGPIPEPPKPAPERIRAVSRSIVRGIRDFVRNPPPTIAPVPPLVVRWACQRASIDRAVADTPSRAGIPRTAVVFRDGSWCVLSPGTPRHQDRLIMALSSGSGPAGPA